MISARRRPAFTALRWTTATRRLTVLATPPFQEGDHVDIKADGSVLRGTVREVRGSGWYSIQLPPNGAKAAPQMRKFRGTQLELATMIREETTTTTTLVNAVLPESPVALPLPPPPTIVDLDEAIRSADPVVRPHDAAYLKQVAHHLSYKKWVMFTDLHCAPSTLDTCLEVLEHVHQLAVERDAGILFLGDFWHHRGTIRVDILNSVLTALESWTQPMVMIPGNHDQVTLGGHNHGLTPLQHAYRCNDTRIAGPLIFSYPTLFGQALFVPHLRDNAIMESLLKSQASKDSTAIFCHADVTGASMNDLIVSQGGVLPRFFPPDIPIYSGHFHMPHMVTKSQVSIEYAGSPYETSLSEAHQDKHLLVVDSAQGWKTVERVPVNLGRKHFKVNSVEKLHSTESSVRTGDRVVVTIPAEKLQDMRRRHQADGQGVSEFDATVARLRKQGAAVEIREVKAVPLRAMGPGAFEEDTRQLEELTPEGSLTSYFAEEVNRESMSNTTAQELLQAGMELMEEMEASNEIAPSNTLTDIQLSSVSLEGFGPFKDHTTYPLLDRGLVLLRGTNKDGGSDSNGTGKSSLAMATLWGLTGSVDPRLVNDAKVADVVTDGCKSAKVVVKGKLNGEKFRITRTKTSSKTGLVFFLGDDDLTTQAVRETQDVIDETLGISLQVLARTIFHGQHAINGLLEATDVKFKDELAFIVPIETWQDAATLARAKARNATKAVTELNGMIKLREEDFTGLQTQRDQALEKTEIRRLAFAEKQKAAHEQSERLSTSSVQYDVPSIEAEVEALNQEIKELQTELQEWKHARDQEVQKLLQGFEEHSRLNIEARTVVRETQRELDRTTLKVEMTDSSLKDMGEKWNIDLSSGTTPVLEVEKCPTCLQPISEEGEGHSHEDLRKVFEDETEVAFINAQNAKKAKEEATETHHEACAALEEREHDLKNASGDVNEAKTNWAIKIGNTEALLDKARSRHTKSSAQLTEAFSSMKTDAEAKAIEATLKAEEWLVQSAEQRYNQLQSDFARAEESLTDMKTQAGAQRSVSSTLSSLSDAFGAKGVQNFVLQNAIEALQTISQAYLDELSDGSLRLSMSLDAGDRIARRAFVRLPDGEFAERPLSSLSGGQWRRCSLALSFGFVDLISRRGRLRPSLLVMDEPLTHLDRTGRSRVGSLLRKLLVNGEQIDGLGSTGICAGTIILILQDLAAEELEEAFDHIDEVVKVEGFSSVSVDERSS